MNTRARPKQMLSSHKPGAQSLTDRSQNSHVYFSEVNLALLSFFWPDSCVGLTKGPPQPFFERQVEAQCGLHALEQLGMLHVFGAVRCLGIRAEHLRPGGHVDLMSLQLLLPHASVNSKCQWMLKNTSNWQRGPGANAYTLKPFLNHHHTRSLCMHHMFKVLLQILPRYWCRLVQHTGPVHCALFSRALASKYANTCLFAMTKIHNIHVKIFTYACNFMPGPLRWGGIWA